MREGGGVIQTPAARLASTVLLPALSRARSAADSTVCRSNLRQLLLGMNLYVQQFGAYPQFGQWVAQIQPYVGASFPERNMDEFATNYLGPRSSVWACPGYSRAKGIFVGFSGGMGSLSGSYLYNEFGMAGVDPLVTATTGWGGTGTNEVTANMPTRENEVAKPSDMIAMSDATLKYFSLPPDSCVWGMGLFGGYITADQYSLQVLGRSAGNPGDGTVINAIQRRHGGRWNTGFCDGHSENLPGPALWDTSNAGVARRWNKDNQPHNAGLQIN